MNVLMLAEMSAQSFGSGRACLGNLCVAVFFLAGCAAIAIAAYVLLTTPALPASRYIRKP